MVNLERNAVPAIHDAVRKQSAEIERQAAQAMASPLWDIGQAAAQVRPNVKEMSWWMLALMVTVGVVLGLAIGCHSGVASTASRSRGNRIEQYLTTQQISSAPTIPNGHASAHKGKVK